MSATMKVSFLKDGSIKLVIDGEVPAAIHDACEESLTDLATQLGGEVKRERLKESEHHHGHHHHGGQRVKQ